MKTNKKRNMQDKKSEKANEIELKESVKIQIFRGGSVKRGKLFKIIDFTVELNEREVFSDKNEFEYKRIKSYANN